MLDCLLTHSTNLSTLYWLKLFFWWKANIYKEKIDFAQCFKLIQNVHFEESQVFIAIAGLYINLTKPLWIKMLVEQNLSNDNILKITILPILPQDDCTTFLPKWHIFQWHFFLRHLFPPDIYSYNIYS